jgi:acetylornithine deacetylase/succinyl-diaminopimelate desuccinylase-like protein
MGSPGLREVCTRHKDILKADVLIASDGPRLAPNKPTIFGGSRGLVNFDLRLKLREGGHHSGNWGGLLANPGIIMAHALASLVDARGKILVPEIRPASIPAAVRQALSEIEITGAGGPEIDPGWGEPGLSISEKVFGWSTLEILAFECGDPKAPAHAIPPEAFARIHIRFTVDCEASKFEEGLRRHLDEHGFEKISIEKVSNGYFEATRMDPDEPWTCFAIDSLERSSGQKVAVLPNLGGSIPNDAFTKILEMPTVWVPHSYGGCSQHAPNEHILESITRQALVLMTGLFWDLAEKGALGNATTNSASKL